MWRLLTLFLLVAACAPVVQEIGPPVRSADIEPAFLVTADEARLPLRRWQLVGAPRAAIVALHGFNDYANAFEAPARRWAEAGLVVYAYDQRGFGGTDQRGIWAGTERMVADARAAIDLIRARHADIPLFLLGESMGGAVVLAALAEVERPTVDGAILVAPAVWGRSTMNPFYRFSLWVSAHVTPGTTLTGRGLKRRPSDNTEMLIALGRDPLVIKATRIDAVYGLMGLMDAALDAVPRAAVPLLVLYGENDEIIPPHATQRMLEIMDPRNRVAVYPRGWHMLLRDLSAQIPQDDVLAWIADAAAPLPSGADRDARRRLAERFERRISLPLTAGR